MERRIRSRRARAGAQETISVDQPDQQSGGSSGGPVAGDPQDFQDLGTIDLTDFFGDGSEPVTVELYRVAPRFVGDQKADGFCENLSPGANLQYVKETYGGGKFRVLQRTPAGRMMMQRYFDIAGAAIVPAAPVAAASPVILPGKDSPAAAPAAVVNVDGVPVSGDLRRDLELIKSVMILKQALRDPSPNEKMLELLLQQQRGPDVLSILKDVGPLIHAVRDMTGEFNQGGGSDGSSMGDLLKTGLMAFMEYMKTMRAAPRPALKPAAPSAPGLARLPVTSPALPVLPPENIENVEPEPPADQPAESENTVALSPQAIIDGAILAIVQNFRLGKPADRVVSYLNMRIPLTADLRQQYLAGNKEALFDQAELLMDQDSENYADDLELRGKFKRFFDEVFDRFLAGA